LLQHLILLHFCHAPDSETTCRAEEVFEAKSPAEQKRFLRRIAKILAMGLTAQGMEMP
jgi:hypothetical protein